MRSRFYSALVAGSLALAGCGNLHEGPLRYADNERLTTDPGLRDKPKLQDAVRSALADLFGDDPRVIRVPKGTGLFAGGRRLASHVAVGDGQPVPTKAVKVDRLDPATWLPVIDPTTGQAEKVLAVGGYELYRQHCLHCHGVSGDGRGPTADFLFPRPRDYRKGLFKFTSTATGVKPTRGDLRRTVRDGLVGTSMPAFDSLMTPEEIEQVIDYVVFLSMRGEVELGLIEEALNADPDAAEPLSQEAVDGVTELVFGKWAQAEEQVVDPDKSRVASSRESVLRGRDLFLGRTKEKLECAGCHGPRAEGNGPSFVDRRIFDLVVFGGDVTPPDAWQSEEVQQRLEWAIKKRYNELADMEKAKAHTGHETEADTEAPGLVPETHESVPALEPFDAFKTKTLTTWKDGSFDDWGQPLRPANLNLGLYKGGRRPLDIYWRIAKGINGAKMMAHASAISTDQIWDLVNFVLALPYQPELLRDAPPGPPPPTAHPAMARR